MKKIVKIFLLTIAMCATLASNAQEEIVPTGAAEAEQADDTTAATIDTIYLYQNWQQIFDHKPALAFSGPIVFPNNGFEYEIYTMNDTAQSIVDNAAMAINVGDSLWLFNSRYLLKHFESDYGGFANYIPLYFSSKVAFCLYWDDYASQYYLRPMTTSTKTVLEPVMLHYGSVKYYMLDFKEKKVYEINQKRLTKLLEPYPELQRRYLSRKHRNDADVLAFYFQKYVEAIDNDPNVPELDFYNGN